jgi:hypothetical protein
MSQASLSQCEICDSYTEDVEDNHISYTPERTVTLCYDCHAEVHNTDKHPKLTPESGEAESYYRDYGVVDMSKVPSMSGWTKTIKSIPCGDDGCNKCPHGPYYYYTRRVDDKQKMEYGGKVTADMMMSQKTISDYDSD